jgi:alkylation response protein AidB-like acyl-CoA dehydrogenase
MPSIYFSEAHEAFRQSVRRFIVDEVAPHAAAWESARAIPREIFRRMGELGFLGINVPEACGGSDADLFFGIAFLEELPRSMMGGFGAAVSVQQFMATPHILRHGSEELKQRYVAPSAAGEKIGALAISEPDIGSDVASLRTAAVRQGDEFVVNGAKTFITNGAGGDFFTLAVRSGEAAGAAGISLLVVDADSPGISRTSIDKLGWHASDTAEIAFDDVHVPAEHLIGRQGRGFAMLMEAFQLERLAAAAMSVGSAQLALEIALDYIRARTVFGKPLSQYQALRHRLADLDSELEAARQLTYHAGWLLQQGSPAVRETSMAKLVATELGKRATDECLQLHGGYGYMEEYPAARMYRDARAATITAGTSEIMREIISRALIDDRPAGGKE